MSIWIAIAFFCAGPECAFWKADELFNNKKDCDVALHKAMDALESNNIQAAGACMDIKVMRT